MVADQTVRFSDILSDHFLRYVQRSDENQAILDLYDGHKSHMNIQLVNWAKCHIVNFRFNGWV